MYKPQCSEMPLSTPTSAIQHVSHRAGSCEVRGKVNYGQSPITTSQICPCGWLVGRCCRFQGKNPTVQPPSGTGHGQRNLHAAGLSSSVRLHSLSFCPMLHMSVPGLAAVFTYIFNPSRPSHSRSEPRMVTSSSSRTGTQTPNSSNFL